MSYDKLALDLEYQVFFQLLLFLNAKCFKTWRRRVAERAKVFVLNFQKLIDMHIKKYIIIHRVKKKLYALYIMSCSTFHEL